MLTLASIAVGLPSLAFCVVGVVAIVRAKLHDIPAVVRALVGSRAREVDGANPRLPLR